MKLRRKMEYFAIGLFVISAVFMITAALIIRWGESKKVTEIWENAKQANKKATDALTLAEVNARTVGGFNDRITSNTKMIERLDKDCAEMDGELGEAQAHCIKLRESNAELREKIAAKDQNITVTLVEPTSKPKMGAGVKALIKDAAKKVKK